jgi:phenylacetate-CoA ligase
MTRTERLKEIIKHGYENAPALRRLMDEAGVRPADIQSVADLPKIPVTSKDKLIQMQQENPPFGGWLAAPKKELQHIFVSPGPLFEPDDEWQPEAFQAVGIDSGDIVINAFAYHMVSAGLLIDAAVRAAGATVVPMGPGNTEAQVDIMLRLGVTGYTGTPSFLKIIFQKAEEMNIDPQDVPLKKAVFSAEPYPPSLRTFFEQDYKMITSQAYATADLGIIAYDRPGEAALRLAQNMIVEITDPATGQPVPAGEPGEIVVTTFNKTYPLVRYGLGDLSAFVGEPDDEGFYPRIKGWLGRVGDAVKVRGMFLHPLQLKGALAKFEGLGNFQASVTRPDAARDHVKLRVELKDAAVASPTLGDAVKAAASQACRLTIDEVEFVEAGAIEPSARAVVDERRWE